MNRPLLVPAPAIKVQEEDIATGGHYCVQGYEMIIPTGVAGAVTELPITSKLARGLLAGQIEVAAENTGDKVDFVVDPDSSIATLSAQMDTDQNQADFVVPLDSGGNPLIFVGMAINIGTIDLGKIIEIHSDKTPVWVKTSINAPSNIAFEADVKVTTLVAHDIHLRSERVIEFGLSKTGASHVDADKVVKVRYTNNDTVAKKLYFYLEWLY